MSVVAYTGAADYREKTVRAAMQQYKCNFMPEQVMATQEFKFRVSSCQKPAVIGEQKG